MRQAEHDLRVLEAQAGSRRALDRLVTHHHSDLVRYAYSLCSDLALARDAVQEAWLTTTRRLRRLDDPRAFRSWLYHAVRWRTLDAVRQRLRRAETPIHELAETGLASAGGGHDEQVMSLRSAIATLPALERETLELFHGRGLALLEIAHIQEVPVGTVKSRLHRARRQLKDTIEGETS